MRDIGLGVNPPRTECGDPCCPFHGKLPVRGRILQGIVVSNSSTGTVMVRRDYLHHVPKYLRYERRHSHIPAHNPPCVNAKSGDTVTIAECRPLSKTVAFVVVEKKEAE